MDITWQTFIVYVCECVYLMEMGIEGITNETKPTMKYYQFYLFWHCFYLYGGEYFE